MTRMLRPLLLFIAVLALPSAALAQWETPGRAFHKVAVFPLEGKHLSVPCASCHIKGQIQGTPTACADCHWIRRQDDKYRTRLGMDCAACHRPTSWTAVAWDHGAATGTPLSGAHKAIGCDGCHRNAIFTGVTLSCQTCHQKEYDATTVINHRAAGFPTDCALCHRPSDLSFTQGRFDHNSTFPLMGLHATQDCASCHRNGVYQGTPRDCYGCHRTNYERTTTPNHAAAGFSTSCASCHRATDVTWRGQAVNHNQFFPLVGVHATQACTACHKNGVYQGTPRDCYGCHRVDYQRTTAPNHSSAGFSTACDSCHKPTDVGWHGQTFNHNQFFTLLGKHAQQACTACHKTGVYKGTPRDCYSCHQADYQRTTTPSHVAASFPTTCENCHNGADGTWTQGRFTHTWFPITSGKHRGFQCKDCHQNASTYTVFQCTTACHPRSQMDSKHQGRSGYAYDSLRCYSCHPTGRGGDPQP